jgi:hypothetical protein
MPHTKLETHLMPAAVGRYNSRCSPPVYGYRSAAAAAAAEAQPAAGSGAMQLELLRGGETLQQVLQFWNQL